jgi:hypothetical protein
MYDEIKMIEERLAILAREREAERIASNKKAAEELALATAKEEARITAGKERERVTNERFAKAEKAKEDAQRAFLQKEREARLAIEHENDAKQFRLAHEAQRQESLQKTQADREYLEEQEKKRLQDALLPKNNADDVPPHPMARFLQHTPK